MIWTVIFLLTLSAVLSSNTMVPSVTKVGDTAELYCLVRDDWWASTDTLTVTWYMGGQEIDPASDSRIEIRNLNFTSSIGSCTFSDPPAGKGFNGDETRDCTISVLRITDVKVDDYNVAINCTWIEDVEPRRREGYMTGSILNPADDNPVTTLSTTKNLQQIGSAECASTSEIFWFVSFHGGITHIDVNDTESEYPLRENWLPANFPQNSSWQKGSLYESIIIADFRGFLKKDVTLRCGPNENSSIKIGTYRTPSETRKEDMETTMLERDAWLVVFAVPVFIFVALFVASKRVGVWSGETSCFGPCLRDYQRMKNPQQNTPDTNT